MNIESLREFCLSLPAVEEDFPFDESVLAFKVGGKIFLLTSLNLPERINLKCDPEKAVDLRERYEEVEPGYHMNKKHWNSVWLNGRLPASLVRELIRHSYELVRDSLPKSIRMQIPKD